MSCFVLRQIHPPGKSALAEAATATALALAAIQNQVHKGKYLEWSDPDANGGMGDERWTDDPAKARRFPSFVAALECWREQSAGPPRPFRPDGPPQQAPDSLQRHAGADRMKLALALLLIASPAAGDTFAERWPSPVAVDPVAASMPELPLRKAYAKERCRRIWFTQNRHRYWSCRR